MVIEELDLDIAQGDSEAMKRFGPKSLRFMVRYQGRICGTRVTTTADARRARRQPGFVRTAKLSRQLQIFVDEKSRREN